MIKKIAAVFFISLFVLISCKQPVSSDPDGGSPEIAIFQNRDFNHLQDTYDFGNVYIGESSEEITFTIWNTGTRNLEISHLNLQNRSSYPNVYTINKSPQTVIPPNSSSELSILFSPTHRIAHHGAVIISSNDDDESEYYLNFTGRGILTPVPIVTGNSPTPDNTPEWTWTVPTGISNIRYRLNNQAWFETNDSTVTNFIPTSSLAEGSHTLEVQFQRVSGMWSESGSFTIVVDQTGPIAPVVTVNETITNNRRPTWSWRIHLGTYSYRFRLNNGNWQVMNITSGLWNYSYTPLLDLPEGQNTLEVQAIDALGNYSSSGSASMVIDLTPPDKPIINGQIYINDKSIPWTWNVPPGTEYFRYYVRDISWAKTVAKDVTSFAWNSSWRNGMTETFYVQAGDKAGNWSEWASFSTTYDTTAPERPIINGVSYTNDPYPEWTWNVPTGIVNIRYRVDNGIWVETGNNTTVSYKPINPLSHGVHTFELQAQDIASNWSESRIYQTRIDLNPPDAPLVSGASITQDNTPTWSWNIPNETYNFRYSINNGAWVETGGKHITSYTVSASLSEGTHLFQVQAQDQIGNWSNSGEFTTKIDYTAPLNPTVSAPQYTNDSTPTWTWILPEQDIVNVRIVMDKMENSGKSYLWNWIELGSGNILSYTPTTPLQDGQYFLRIELCDTALNWSSSNGYTQVEVDTVAPTKPTLNGPVRTADQTPTWSLSRYSNFDKSRYRINGSNWIVENNSFVTSYTPVSNLPSGTHLFEVQIGDRAGNWSPIAEKTTIIELLPPAPPVISEVVIKSTEEISISWSGGSSTETGYVLERKVGNGTYIPVLNNTSRLSYIDSDISELTDYSYRVKSINQVGESTYSNVQSASFPLLRPNFSYPSSWTWDPAQNGYHITWTDRSLHTHSFVLERKIDGVDLDFKPLTILPANTLSYQDSNLPEYADIHYRLRARNSSGIESGNDFGWIMTPVSPPSDLHVSDWFHNDKIVFQWSDNSSIETSYKVYGRYNTVSPYSLLAELPANTTEYVFDEGYSTPSEYYFKVEARVDHSNGSYNLSDPVETDLSQVPVKPIQYLNHTSIDGGIKLTWALDPSPRVIGFTLERKEDIHGTYVTIANIGPSSRSYNDTPVTMGKTYYYRISGYTSTYRTSYFERSIRIPIDINTPTGLRVSNPTSSTVDLTWQDNSLNENGFYIERKEGTNGRFAQVGTVTANVRSFTDSNLMPETNYEYRVRAFASYYYSSYSMSAYATTTAMTPSPVNLSVQVSQNIVLTWEYPYAGVTGFRVQRYKGNVLDGEFDLGGTSLSYTDTGLPAGESYTYHVSAKSSNGLSEKVSSSVTTIPTGAVALTANSPWQNFDLSGGGDEDWYYLQVQAGDRYQISWDDAFLGSGTCTADVQVSLFHKSIQDEAPIVIEEDTAYATPFILQCNATEIIYIKVNGKVWSENGTYRIGITKITP